MVWLESARTGLALACDQQPVVRGKEKRVMCSPGVSAGQSTAQQQQNTDSPVRERELVWRGYQPVSLSILLGEWRSA